jgi:Tfp pilus assembly protein PilO
MKKNKIKPLSLIGPAAYCSFKPESQNSSSRYREHQKQAQALMQVKKKVKKIKSNLSHSQGQLPATASSQSLRIQALVIESIGNKPQP